MDTKHGNSAEPAVPECPNGVPTTPRIYGGWAVVGGVLVLGSLVAVAAIVLYNRPHSQESHVSRLAKHTPSEVTLHPDQPVIPLEILFPAATAGTHQTVGKAVLAGPTGDQARLVDRPATGDLGPGISMSIPTTASAVVSEAREVTKELAKQFPNEPDAMETTARMHLWLGDSDEAGRIWEASIALNPSYGYAHEGLGILASKRGKNEEAISRYRKALECFGEAPGGLGTRIRLATLLIDQGQLDDAIDLLKRDTQSTLVPTEVLVLLGMAHLQSKRYAEARRYYEAAIASYPMHANAHFGLATACTRLGDTEAAANHMKRFQALRTGERDIRIDQRSHYDDVEEMRVELAQMHSNAGRIYHAHGDLTGAERHWRRAASLDPHAVECRQAMAWFCQQGGRIRDAVALLRELAEIEPDNPAYLLEVGRLEMELGDYDEAEKAFQTILQKMPRCADAHASLARLYLRSGRYPERVAGLAGSAAQLEPTVENLLLLAVAGERSGDVSGAAVAMERVTMLAPNRADYQQISQELRKKLAAKNAP